MSDTPSTHSYNLRSRSLQLFSPVRSLASSIVDAFATSPTPQPSPAAEADDPTASADNENNSNTGGTETGETEMSTALSKYNGKSDPAIWLDLFVYVVNDNDEASRMRKIPAYLENDALDWFARNVVPTANDMAWADFRARFIARFTRNVEDQTLAAHLRVLQKEESVEAYFNAKTAIMTNTTMTDANKIASLTHGLPQRLKAQLLALPPDTVDNWLVRARNLESAFPYEPQPRRDNRQSARQQPSAPRPQPSGDRPPPPCQHCAKLGRTENHWHRECPNRAKQSAAPSNVPAIAYNNFADPGHLNWQGGLPQ